MPKTPKQHRYTQTVIAGRQKFIAPAQRLFYAALRDQVKPVAEKLQHHFQSHGMEHLIKEDALIIGFKRVYKQVGMHFGKATYDSLISEAKAMKALTRKDGDDFEDLLDAAIDEFIRTTGAKMITAITETTRESVRTWLADAIKNGTGAAKLASDFEKHFKDFNKIRSMAIARTEVGRASNWANYEAGNMTGLELEKTWLHAGSSQYDRPEHVAASGQTVDYDEPFEIDSDYTPMYPQDGSGGASEEVNCNCTFYQRRIGSKY